MRHARVPECLARIVHADLLIRSEASEQKLAGRDELDRARALVGETGALIFEPLFNSVNLSETVSSRKASNQVG